jgi:ABC-type Na+ efflux pump permease subunit
MKNRKYSHRIWEFYGASFRIYSRNSIRAGLFIIAFFHRFVCFYIFGADSDLIAYFVAWGVGFALVRLIFISAVRIFSKGFYLSKDSIESVGHIVCFYEFPFLLWDFVG